jgi:lysophospholipase L1-like esterase
MSCYSHRSLPGQQTAGLHAAVLAGLLAACSSGSGASDTSAALGGSSPMGGSTNTSTSSGTGGHGVVSSATLAGGNTGATRGSTGGGTSTGGTNSASSGSSSSSGGSSSAMSGSKGGTTAKGGSSNATGGTLLGSGGTTKAVGGAATASGGTSSAGSSPSVGGSSTVSGSGTGGKDSGSGAGSNIAGRSGSGGGGRASVAGGPSQTGGAVSTGSSGSSGVYAPCPKNGDPCKILPLGDSITNGVASTDLGGYRSQLFKLVVAASQNVTFTGSQSSGPDQVSGKAFPKHHEGHNGYTIDPNTVSYATGISTVIPSPAFDTVPNIVLLMIGTNDVNGSTGQSTMADRLETLLDKIIAAAPSALIVLAETTPLASGSSALTQYDAKIPGIVQARAAKGQHMVLVDMSKMPTSDLSSDGIHPNDQGYVYMANTWYAAIKDLLPN